MNNSSSAAEALRAARTPDAPCLVPRGGWEAARLPACPRGPAWEGSAEAVCVRRAGSVPRGTHAGADARQPPHGRVDACSSGWGGVGRCTWHSGRPANPSPGGIGPRPSRPMAAGDTLLSAPGQSARRHAAAPPRGRVQSAAGQPPRQPGSGRGRRLRADRRPAAQSALSSRRGRTAVGAVRTAAPCARPPAPSSPSAAGAGRPGTAAHRGELCVRRAGAGAPLRASGRAGPGRGARSSVRGGAGPASWFRVPVRSGAALTVLPRGSESGGRIPRLESASCF